MADQSRNIRAPKGRMGAVRMGAAAERTKPKIAVAENITSAGTADRIGTAKDSSAPAAGAMRSGSSTKIKSIANVKDIS